MSTSSRETYEFCLAYAAKGSMPGWRCRTTEWCASGWRRWRRPWLQLPDAFVALAEERGAEHEERYRAFIDVMRRDSAAGLAAVQLVLAQPGITSQMVDNLNGMIHLRALLTDVFLLDEILRPDAVRPPHTPPAEEAQTEPTKPPSASGD